MKLKNQNLLHNFKSNIKSLDTKIGIMDKLDDCLYKLNLDLKTTKHDCSYMDLKQELKKVSLNFFFERIKFIFIFS